MEKGGVALRTSDRKVRNKLQAINNTTKSFNSYLLRYKIFIK